MRRWTIAAFAFAACAGPATEETPPTPEEHGIEGQAPPATGGYPSVVMLVPEPPVKAVPPEEPALMDQAGTAFWPKLLVVRPGQAVDFKNSEDVLHNVHVTNSDTRKTEFNVGTAPGAAGTYRHVFDLEGAYDVMCNIHPSMAAFVIVTAAPYVVVADSEGAFELETIPEGTYQVRVWNLEPSRRIEKTIAIGASTRRLPLIGS